MRRIIFGFIAVIFLIFLMIWIFGGSKNSTPKPVNKPMTLVDYATTDSSVQFTYDGPINSEEKHRMVRITVAANERTLEVLQGYENNVLKNQHFSNNQTAYDVFLHALEQAGFSRNRKTSMTDERGMCATGNRYIYLLTNNGDQVQRTWTASCNGMGTSAGTPSLINSLFQRQIPDYEQQVSNVGLYQ